MALCEHRLNRAREFGFVGMRNGDIQCLAYSASFLSRR
jgi:hypothetical protein